MLLKYENTESKTKLSWNIPLHSVKKYHCDWFNKLNGQQLGKIWGAERTLGRRRRRSCQPDKEEARKQHEQNTTKVIKLKGSKEEINRNGII